MDKATGGKEKRYSPQFKQKALDRMALGLISNVELAAELGVRTKLLYRWRDLRKRYGEGAFHRKLGRPRGSTGAGPGRPAVAPGDVPLVLVSAERKRIAELERQLGRKQLEVDFFRQAFVHVRGMNASRIKHGATESTTPSSPISRAKED